MTSPPRADRRTRNGDQNALSRHNQNRDTIVNAAWRGGLWIALKLAEGGLPVIGKALAGGAVAVALRWWLGE